MTAVVAQATKGCFGNLWLSQLPKAASCVYVQHRDTSSASKGKLSALKKGTGGRSSFSGVVATVFGANGYLGRYVCNQLGKIGSQIIIPYRCDPYDIERLRLVGDLGQVLFFPFHLKDEESIRKTVQYSNVVINLIGQNYESRHFSIEDVHIEGARRLARIAKECGVERFIQMSNVNAKADPQVIFQPSRVLKAQYEGELAVREEFPEAIVFKASDMYGEEDYFLNYYRKYRRWSMGVKFLPLWKRGEKTVKQPVHVGDVAKGIIQAIRSPGLEGKNIDAVGPHRYYLSDIVDYILRVTRRENQLYVTGNPYHISTLRAKAEIYERIKLYAPLVNREKLELEHITDWPTPGNLTLDDLGIDHQDFVNLTYYYLFPRRRNSHYNEKLGEIPHPEPPLTAENFQLATK